ncbi:MAG: hypothetical protein VB118_03030 [Oscillospiraceae bacterium]|nr:hypothetical protein [Oscillospiraceae bacterium]
MINEIIDAVSIKINETFGDDKEIYTEIKKQDLKEPCFFISCINPINTQVLGKRYFRNNLFCIQYFPSSKEPKSECNQVLEALFLAMECITVESDLVRGTKMHGETVDGILNFFVNYDMFVYKVEDSTLMGEMSKPNVDVKG